jgi:hypothetical protein
MMVPSVPQPDGGDGAGEADRGGGEEGLPVLDV